MKRRTQEGRAVVMELDEAREVLRGTHEPSAWSASRLGQASARVLAECVDLRAELDRLRLELHRERMASLRRAHRAVGGAVHHLDGDAHNNDPGNLVIVDPADNTSRQPR